MGILPLQFLPGDTRATLGLTGAESFDITGVTDLFTPDARVSGLAGDRTVAVTATAPDGTVTSFKALVRIDTPGEVQYYEHGGILQFVLRGLLES
jgi:aconitate hydratase